MTEIRERRRKPNPVIEVPIPWPNTPIAVPAYNGVIIGIDASLTNSGVVVLQEGLILARSFEAKKLRGVERLAWFRTQFQCLFKCYHPELVVIEGYAFGAKMQREAMGELGGVVRLACHDANVRFTVVPPTSLKLFVTGAGNGPKDNMSKEIYKRFGVDLADNNQVDAAGLAIMGLATVADMSLTEFQKRALGKLE